MKDKFFWALLILIIFLGVVINLLDTRISDLEEKASHFRHLEKRLHQLIVKERLRETEQFRANNGGWFIKVDSLEQIKKPLR